MFEMSPSCCFQKQMGAGLPIALFVITVLSLIVLGMSQLQESASKSITLQVQSQRAFLAAQSGAQKVLADMFPADPSASLSCPANFTLSFSAGGLNACTATVQCSDIYSPVLTIESIGVCGSPGPEQASRTVEVRVK